MLQHKSKILITGGGTGGHIFPAIAIAESLKYKLTEVDFLFVGAKNKMEMKKIPDAGYKIIGLWISGLQRRFTLQNLLFPLKVILSFYKARKIIKSYSPDVIVGTGGYASYPTVKAAYSVKIPTLIQEQNSYPGITNKNLAKHADTICVAYEGMEKYFPTSKIVLTGNPVRKDIIELKNKTQEAIDFFKLNNKKAVVLVIGGSQGAKAINEAIDSNLETLQKNNIQIIWQTGKYYYDQARNTIAARKLNNVFVHEFISRMDLAYSAAGVIVSRAGAIAISEICVVQKPTIFVPLPTAAEDHQTKNAMKLVNKNAAVLIQNKNVHKQLADMIIEIINNQEKQKELSENIKQFSVTDASDRIADEVIKLLKKEN